MVYPKCGVNDYNLHVTSIMQMNEIYKILHRTELEVILSLRFKMIEIMNEEEQIASIYNLLSPSHFHFED